MSRDSHQSRTLIALLAVAGLYIGACGPSIRSQTPSLGHVKPKPAAPTAVQTAPQGPEPQAPAEDPVLLLIAESDRHFKAGQKELDLGHVEAAKTEFSRAGGVLRES